MDNILELGSVIKLKNSGVELMVIGYNPIKEEDNETYDYLCVNQFLGMVNEENLLAVKEEAIESVVFHGAAYEK